MLSSALLHKEHKEQENFARKIFTKITNIINEYFQLGKISLNVLLIITKINLFKTHDDVYLYVSIRHGQV